MEPTFVVAAVALADGDGRQLLVRKRGTRMFMNPGGKLEPGETALAAAVREVREELGVVLDPSAVESLGVWDAPAANEPGALLRAHAFRAVLPDGAEPRVGAEIDALRRVALDEIERYDDLAPLFLRRFVPALRGR